MKIYIKITALFLSVLFLSAPLFSCANNPTPPVTEPVTEPATEPATEPVTKPATEPVTDPVTDPITEPITEPITDPIIEPVTEPATDQVAEPVTEPATEPVTEPTTEPVIAEVYSEYEGFYYKINTDNTVTLVEYVGNAEDIVIPSHIEGLPVTELGNGLFGKQVLLYCIGTAYQVTYELEAKIGDGHQPRSITIPDTVTTIGERAFAGCMLLEEIYIPDSVVSIGKYAFVACLSLRTVRLPKNLTVIEPYTFSHCEALNFIDIPDTVTTVGSCAFQESGLVEITFTNVEELGSDAFSYCKELKKVTLSPKMTVISAFLFERCYNLVDVVIPEGITIIERYAFIGCSSYKDVTLPSTVTHIYTAAFDIPYETFTKRSIVLPDSLIYVADHNFYGDGYNYTYANGAYYLGTADNPYFMLCEFDYYSEIQQIHPDTKILAVQSGHNGAELNIPDSVTVIMRLHLKYFEDKVNQIIIPASVKYVYEGAFYKGTEATFENSELTYSEYVQEYYDWKYYRGSDIFFK